MNYTFNPTNTAFGMDTQNSGVLNMASDIVDQFTFSPSLCKKSKTTEFANYNLTTSPFGVSFDSSNESSE